MNIFHLPHSHRFICGTTGTGKTYKFIKDFERCDYGGIYINYTRNPCPFIPVDGSYEIEDIIDAVYHGDKLSYVPALDRKRAKAEIAYIIHKFFECKRFSENHPFVFAIDECHTLAREGERNSMIEQIATTGRVFGFKGIFITQSPSMVEKILIKQSDIHVIFTLSDYEREYFRTKGIDFDKVQGLVRSTNENVISHKYCVWQNGILNGPYEEKI